VAGASGAEEPLMTTKYVAELVAAYPSIREVWLYGSRANGTAGEKSDWDYLAFADVQTLNGLRADTRFHHGDVDLMIVTDDSHWEKPWADPDGPKSGTLGIEPGGMNWRLASATEALYEDWKPLLGPACRSERFEYRAKRVYSRG
jgi:hypothetical protein